MSGLDVIAQLERRIGKCLEVLLNWKFCFCLVQLILKN